MTTREPPDDSDPFGSTAIVPDQEAGSSERRLTLLVIAEGIFVSHPLPVSGTVVIGRTLGVEILIEDASVSRRHARLAIGETLVLEDLGSANGTKVAGERIEAGQPVEIEQGQVIDIGSVLVTVQQRSARTRPRRLWTHDYFETRLEDECARATRVAGRFAVAMLRVADSVGPATVQEAIASAIRSSDVVAAYGPHQYEILLNDSSTAHAQATIDRIIEAMGGAEIRVGIACFPTDGNAPEELVAQATERARDDVPDRSVPSLVVVENGAMEKLHRIVERIAASEISVLVLGETGVGKEVLASRIHQLSPRKNAPLVRINGAALPDALFESELFGYERGSFTGAVGAKPGLIETANGGTLFLDEVGELSPSSQAKLLRVLEAREVQRVGALAPRQVNVRFIAATNRDLERRVQEGEFREDLFFRLNGISLTIPPLRERTEEIAPLAEAFLRQSCERSNLPLPALSNEAMDLLIAYSWPGNIRELKNLIERAAVLCTGPSITAEHLPVEKLTARRIGGGKRALASEPAPKRELIEALEQCAGNQTLAAKLLGVSRRTLMVRMDKYGIPRPRKR